MAAKSKSKLEEQSIFALDIGTRSIIGIVGIVENERLKVIAIEREEHTKRAMIDGQIEDIEQVARLALAVKKRLESKLGFPLTRVCIAAAGRALLTQRGSYELEFPEATKIGPEIISRLEAGAISQAEEAFSSSEEAVAERRFFLVGYSVLTYTLDNYTFSTILEHKGRRLKAEIIATFLPSEVVESLYSAMNKIDLEVVSLTLEPIAAINASIPREHRLLNLVMVDIGAGTSDIAACRDGGITGYTMATLAGDEITEALMKHYLIDFNTAEKLKFGLSNQDELTFHDILGFEQKIKAQEALECIREPLQSICKEIAEQIIELNHGAPSAVFLAGGGSKMAGLKECITEYLGMDSKRVAIVGNNFALSAFSDEYDLNNPEYATPLGIAVSAGLNLINDSYRVTLNGKPAKLFKSGVFTIMDVLMMNGYGYKHLVSRSGRNIVVQLNGKRTVIPGAPSSPAVLKLNGSDCAMTQVIHAGDAIEFQPAVCGKDASAVLGDILKPGLKTAVVNGRKASFGTALHTGDVIVTESFTEEKESTPSRTEVESPDGYEGGRTAKGSPAPARKANSNTQKAEPEPAAEPAQETVPKLQTAVFPSQANPDKADGVPNILHIILNDIPVTLNQKADGTAYMLMDVLERSGLDFQNLSKPVTITVNGENAAFLQKLCDGDVIVIRCE